MTRCTKTRAGDCPKHPGTGAHQCARQRGRHPLGHVGGIEDNGPRVPAELHRCRCGLEWWARK